MVEKIAADPRPRTLTYKLVRKGKTFVHLTREFKEMVTRRKQEV